MKMKISILYNMIVNSQLNRNNLTRCYTKSFQDVSKTFINVNDETGSYSDIGKHACDIPPGDKS